MNVALISELSEKTELISMLESQLLHIQKSCNSTGELELASNAESVDEGVAQQLNSVSAELEKIKVFPLLSLKPGC